MPSNNRSFFGFPGVNRADFQPDGFNVRGNELFLRNVGTSDRLNGALLLGNKTVFSRQRRNVPIFRKRRRRPDIVAAFPFYQANNQNGSFSVAGPFEEVFLSTDDFDAIALINTGPRVDEWQAVGRSNNRRRFRYWDSEGNLLQDLATVERLAGYAGGGFYTEDSTVRINRPGTNTQSTTTSGDTTTTSGIYIDDDYMGNTVTVGSFTSVRTTQSQTPEATSTDNIFTRDNTTIDRNWVNQVWHEQPRPDGLITDLFDQTYTLHSDDIYERTLNRSNSAYTQIDSFDEQISQTAAGNLRLYPGLNVPFNYTFTNSIDRQDNLSRTTGGTFSQNDVESNETERIINKDTGILYRAADDGSGCLYFARKERYHDTTSFTRTEGGTVGGITVTSYPPMRSPTLVGKANNLMISQFLGQEQGADGGWFNGNIGFSLGPEDIDSVLDCPTGVEFNRRTTLGGADLIRADFDSPGAYGDNTAGFFTSQGAAYNVYCGYTYTITPSTTSDFGGLIASGPVLIDDSHPAQPALIDFPSKNIAITERYERSILQTDTFDFFAFIPGVGSLRIPNANPESSPRPYTDRVNESPQWGLLSDPTYRGVFQLPNTGTAYMDHDGPRQIQRIERRTLDETYTDPTTAAATTQGETLSYEYHSTETNPFEWVGRKVFIVRSDAQGTIRFEATVTAIATEQVQNNLLTPNTDATGFGLPSKTELRGLTCEITGSQVINFDEFTDSQGIASALYFPYIENLRPTDFNVRWPEKSRMTLRFRTADEINSDTDQDTTLLGKIAIAGIFYRNGGLNATEIYEIRRDPTLPSTGLAQGEVSICKINRQQRPFKTIPSEVISNNYTSTHLSQWPG